MTTIHHLDCCPMRPPVERLVNGGDGRWLARGRMVAHCLLIETESGLVLVDSGIGLDDIAAPDKRLGGFFITMTAPRLDPKNTAVRQIEALGYKRDDVRHVVLTHMDVDHAGGLADFPRAKVHVDEDEHRAATRLENRFDRMRYRPLQWAHGPDWQLHRADGEAFFGFKAVRAIVEPEVLLVPLRGHSRGHSAVAVNTGSGWLLHAGDSYFHHQEMNEPPSCPPGLALFQRTVAVANDVRLENQARLRQLCRGHDEVKVFSAHDAREYDAMS
jgi:glyoxylase-like metal-dependent hydrolase (beta-lactamase superfamily II)